MTEAADTLLNVAPSATPNDANLAAWQALPRDEQLRRMQAKLAHSDCSAVSAVTMSDILSRAQATAKLRYG